MDICSVPRHARWMRSKILAWYLCGKKGKRPLTQLRQFALIDASTPDIQLSSAPSSAEKRPAGYYFSHGDLVVYDSSAQISAFFNPEVWRRMPSRTSSLQGLGGRHSVDCRVTIDDAQSKQVLS